MGTKITSVGTRAPWNSRILPPVTRGLEFWFDADTEIRRGAFNRAMSKPAGTITGTPAAAATYISMSPGTGYVATQTQETIECTLFTLAKTQNVDAPTMFVSSFSSAVNPALAPGYSGASFGMSIYSKAAGDMLWSACRDNGSGGLTSSGISLAGSKKSNEWAIRVMRVAADKTTAWDKTTGLTAASANRLTRVPATDPIRVGSPVGSANQAAYPGVVDISQAIYYSAALTDAEIDQIVEVMRKRAARLGITA